MQERVEVFLIDDEGIFLRAYAERQMYFYRGNPEGRKSPLSAALRHYYMENAPKTLLCKGYETPVGLLLWENEWATPYSDDEDIIEIGERLFLVDETGERFMDDYIYRVLFEGKVPEDWHMLKHDHR